MSQAPNPKRSPLTWVPSLYFAQGLPYYAVALVASLMFKSMGESNEQIARWTGLLGLAWVFKPLWSPFLELASSKKMVVVAFQLLGGAALALIAAALQMPGYFVACVAVFGVVAIASATHDIAADGLYIANLDAKQQASYAGWIGTFFNAGKFVSLGGLVILAGYLEKSMAPSSAWAVVFLVLGAMLTGLGLYHMWALPSTKNPDSANTSAADIARTLREVIVDFFQKPGIWVCILFIILFRAGEAQVQTIGPLFLKEARELGGLGLTTEQIGGIYGTAGTVAFIGGSILGGYFTSWLSLKRAILWLILAMNLPNLVFYFLSATLPTSMPLISGAIMVEMFGYGFGFVGLILYMMQVVSVGKFQTAHYAFATGVMQLGFVLFKMVSGDIQVALGYQNFFIWCVVSALPVLVLSQLIPMAVPKQADGLAGDQKNGDTGLGQQPAGANS